MVCNLQQMIKLFSLISLKIVMNPWTIKVLSIILTILMYKYCLINTANADSIENSTNIANESRSYRVEVLEQFGYYCIITGMAFIIVWLSLVLTLAFIFHKLCRLCLLLINKYRKKIR